MAECGVFDDQAAKLSLMRLALKGHLPNRRSGKRIHGQAESERGSLASLLGLRFKVDEQSRSRVFLKRGRFWPVAEPRKHLVMKLGWPGGIAWVRPTVPLKNCISHSLDAMGVRQRLVTVADISESGKKSVAASGPIIDEMVGKLIRAGYLNSTNVKIPQPSQKRSIA
jgi:hypothetical protein